MQTQTSINIEVETYNMKNEEQDVQVVQQVLGPLSDRQKRAVKELSIALGIGGIDIVRAIQQYARERKIIINRK